MLKILRTVDQSVLYSYTSLKHCTFPSNVCSEKRKQPEGRFLSNRKLALKNLNLHLATQTKNLRALGKDTWLTRDVHFNKELEKLKEFVKEASVRKC